MIGLEYMRLKKNLTLQQIGKELQVTHQAVSNWEKKKKPLPQKHKKKLSELLNLPEDYLDKELSEVEKEKINDLYVEQKVEIIKYDSEEYCRLRNKIVVLANRVEDDFMELFGEDDCLTNLEEMKRYVNFIEQMLDVARKGEYDV